MSDGIEVQQAFWNQWNASTREKELGNISTEQAEVIETWLERVAQGRRDLKILEVGCGAGWLCERLTRFGQVTATDLSNEVLARAAKRLLQVSFIAGDFMALDFGSDFDVIVSLEVLAHVASQAAFLSKIADLLKPGGYLMLATQNKPALERSDVPSAQPGQLRRWTDRHELKTLLAHRFHVAQMFSITPHFNRGLLRVINSGRLQRAADAAKLAWLLHGMKKFQEKAWLGWTIMTLARRSI